MMLLDKHNTGVACRAEAAQGQITKSPMSEVGQARHLVSGGLLTVFSRKRTWSEPVTKLKGGTSLLGWWAQ